VYSFYNIGFNLYKLDNNRSDNHLLWLDIIEEIYITESYRDARDLVLFLVRKFNRNTSLSFISAVSEYRRFLRFFDCRETHIKENFKYQLKLCLSRRIG
jgi:hypothetical protein